MGWVLWLWAAVASASGLEEYFPSGQISNDQARTALTGKVLGEPARTYDQLRASAVVDRDRRILATGLETDVAELKISESLQRYARLALAVARVGRADRVVGWFLAEHAGLAAEPHIQGTFVVGDEEGAGELIRPWLQGEEGTTYAVATEEVDGSFVGLVVSLSGNVAFEAFPRVVSTGATVRIPGTVLDAAGSFALFVQGSGTEVATYPLEGEGAFDVEFTLPPDPGVYRVAMTRYQKGQLPSQPFFFSVYGGVEPPSNLQLPNFDQATVSDVAAFEGALLRSLSQERSRFGLSKLSSAGGPETIRSLLERMPENDRAAARFLDRELAKDPLPSEPHGIWRAAFGSGYHSPASTAWAWVQHPAWRSRVLDGQFDRALVGVKRKEKGFSSAMVLIAPPGDEDSLRDQVFAELGQRWPEGKPKEAPKLQAALDEVAQRFASGKTKSARFGKEIDKIFARRDLVQGKATAALQSVPPGQELDLEGVVVEDWSKHLAVGMGSGDLGDSKGYTYVVLVIVMSAKAM